MYQNGQTRKFQKTRNGKKRKIVSRPRRFFSEIISIGVGTAAMAIPTTNKIQMLNLKNEIKAYKNSLRSMDQSLETYQARILQLTKG